MRVPWASSIDKCSDLGRTCNCLPYLKKSDKGNVWLAADGVRYNMEMDLDSYEKSDPITWSFKLWDVQNNEKMRFTQRLLQFEAADRSGPHLISV